MPCLFALSVSANAGGGFICDGETVDICETFSATWKVGRVGWSQLVLSDCKEGQPQTGDKLLLFVSRAMLYNYGKYEVVTVIKVTPTTDKNG